MSRNRVALPAATLAAVCVLAACGSSASKAGPAATSGPTTTATSVTTTAPASTTTAAPARASQWVTYYQNNARTGFATDGPAAPKHLHARWTSPTLDGDVYAEPLVVGKRIIVATGNDTVYSLNAATGAVVWSTHLGTPVPASALPCGDVDPVGITSTPAVDVAGGRVYAVGMVKPAVDTLFDLDLATGHLIASKVVDIPGMNPKAQNQRSGLTFSGGKVFIPYGGRFGDCGDYHGRIAAVKVSATGLGAFSSYTLPTQGEGGWWTPSGASEASDGSLYLAAGNSSSQTTFDYGNSVVRLSPSLKLLDFWAPKDWKALNATDGDIGTSGPVLLPGNRVFQVGKHGFGYVLDASHLGGIGGELYSALVCHTGVWGGVAHAGDTLYVPCNGELVQVKVVGDRFTTGWRYGMITPGPAVVTPQAVWTFEVGTGKLFGLDPATGAIVAEEHLGDAPSRFTVPVVGGGRVIVGVARQVLAFGS